MRDNIERWLIHGNNSFTTIEHPDNTFTFLIKHVGSFETPIEVFQPKNQSHVIVIGGKVPLKNNQNARYRKLTDYEKSNIDNKIAEYCVTIKAVHRSFLEDGKRKFGAFVVLDKEEQFNEPSFHESLNKAIEMTDKLAQYIVKFF